VALNGINLGQELLNVPMGQMIESVAMAIAKAQWNLDKSSMTVAEMMSGRRVLRDLDNGKLIDATGNQTKDPVILDSRVYFGYAIDRDGDVPVRKQQLVSMMELGFTPQFYQFVDTIIEVKIAISIHSQTEDTKLTQTDTNEDKKENELRTKSASEYRGSGYWGPSGYGFGSSGSSSGQFGVTNTNTVTTSQVNAAYSQKFGYSAEGASLLRTKLVPVPPPAILEERIREVMRIENAYEQWNMLKQLHDTTEKAYKAWPSPDLEALEVKKKQLDHITGRLNMALDMLMGIGTA
jgi:hypothetical protein